MLGLGIRGPGAMTRKDEDWVQTGKKPARTHISGRFVLQA